MLCDLIFNFFLIFIRNRIYMCGVFSSVYHSIHHLAIGKIFLVITSSWKGTDQANHFDKLSLHFITVCIRFFRHHPHGILILFFMFRWCYIFSCYRNRKIVSRKKRAFNILVMGLLLEFTNDDHAFIHIKPFRQQFEQEKT